MKINSLYPLKCTEDTFFRLWVEFLTPFHKLTKREKDVAARVIAQYVKLSESIKDQEVLEQVLWSQTSRKDMRDSLGMSKEFFQMVVGKLREAGVLTGGAVNNKYLPHLSVDEDGNKDPRYMLCILFDWSSSANPIKRNGQEQKG